MLNKLQQKILHYKIYKLCKELYYKDGYVGLRILKDTIEDFQMDVHKGKIK